jgi:hypothetical protein
MQDTQKLTMAAISGAAHAMQFKEKNPKATEQEVIKHITENAESILEKIDGEL